MRFYFESNICPLVFFPYVNFNALISQLSGYHNFFFYLTQILSRLVASKIKCFFFSSEDEIKFHTGRSKILLILMTKRQRKLKIKKRYFDFISFWNLSLCGIYYFVFSQFHKANFCL